MSDRYEYELGRCNICHEDKEVRWKNLYLIGSEGINICHPCEMDLLAYLRKKSNEFAIAKKEKIKKSKERKNVKTI